CNRHLFGCRYVARAREEYEMNSRTSCMLFGMQLALIMLLLLMLALREYQILVLNWRLLLQGAGTTILLTAIGYSSGLFIAFVMSLVRFYRVPIVAPLIGIVVEIVRASPQLMVIFWIYFGVPF